MRGAHHPIDFLILSEYDAFTIKLGTMNGKSYCY